MASIGLEVECCYPAQPASVYDSNSVFLNELCLALERSKLFEAVNIGGDSSIKPPSGYRGCEIRLMFKQHATRKAINFLCKQLEERDFGVNSSCGLHVHIDCRARDYLKVYEKLVRSLPYMTKLVKRNRLANSYCRLNEQGRQPGSRYSAVNPYSYSRHKTVEVRLHHGSIDAKEIIPWVQFLLRVVRAAMPATPVVPEEAHTTYKIPPYLLKLLKEKEKAA